MQFLVALSSTLETGNWISGCRLFHFPVSGDARNSPGTSMQIFLLPGHLPAASASPSKPQIASGSCYCQNHSRPFSRSHGGHYGATKTFSPFYRTDAADESTSRHAAGLVGRPLVILCTSFRVASHLHLFYFHSMVIVNFAFF